MSGSTSQIIPIKDHRQIGQEQDLFVISEIVGSGLPLFAPKGATLRRVIEEYIYNVLEEHDYRHVWIPHIARKELYKISGHLDKFNQDMFPVMETKGREYYLKAMNCPHHIQLFARKQFSYKDMPQRYAETSTVYRSEQSGELGGLTRVLSITQDDAHVFCRKDQVKTEFKKAIEINKQMLKDFGFNKYWIRLSLWDKDKKDKYLGDEKAWEEMQELMREILTETKTPFKEATGEAAFYGPKMDLIVVDSHGREWQLSTIQMDFNLPKRFEIFYTNDKGEKVNPYMLHRASFGSTERFLGIYIEHTQGIFPIWLSPVQVSLLPIADRHIEYAQKLAKELKAAGIRVEVDSRQESLPAKVRDTTLQKVPFIGIIGDKEITDSTVSIRDRGGKNVGAMKLSVFLQDLKEKIDKKI